MRRVWIIECVPGQSGLHTERNTASIKTKQTNCGFPRQMRDGKGLPVLRQLLESTAGVGYFLAS